MMQQKKKSISFFALMGIVFLLVLCLTFVLGLADEGEGNPEPDNAYEAEMDSGSEDSGDADVPDESGTPQEEENDPVVSDPAPAAEPVNEPAPENPPVNPDDTPDETPVTGSDNEQDDEPTHPEESTEPSGESETVPGENQTQEPAPEETPKAEETSEPQAIVTGEPTQESPKTEETVVPVTEQTTEPARTESPTTQETPKPETAAPVEVDALSVTAKTNAKIVRVGETVGLIASIEGGLAPFEVSFKVKGDGDTQFEDTLRTTDRYVVTYFTQSFEETAEIEIHVSDSLGNTAEDYTDYRVSSNQYELEEEWARSAKVQLTGDFAVDLVAVARTQIGYRESSSNVIEDNGMIRGYTRYGDYIGSLYTEWCAAFVSFAVHYAELPFASQFNSANVGTLYEQANALGAYHAAEGYEPKAGDIVFFKVESNPQGHIGIVESATRSLIQTIEGNVNNAVVEKTYSLGHESIVGYMSMQDLMKKYGVEPIGAPTLEPVDRIVEEEEPGDETEPEEEINYEDLPKAIEYVYGEYETKHTGTTLKSSINVRQKPDAKSRKQITIVHKDTEIKVIGYAIVEETGVWYYVEYQGERGYIRSDLLDVEEDGLSPEDSENTEETGDVEETEPTETSESAETTEEPSETDENPAEDTLEEEETEPEVSPEEETGVHAIVDGNSATLVWKMEADADLYAVMDYRNHLTSVVGLSETGVCRVVDLAPGVHPLRIVRCSVEDGILVYDALVDTVEIEIQ